MSSEQHDETRTVRRLVQQLLSEDVDVARDREQRTFVDLAGTRADSVVLFGAGGLGRRCLGALRRHGIEPLAFADNNRRLWGMDVDGLCVLPPAEAASRFGRKAVFVISIWGARGADCMSDRVEAVHALGCDLVLPFGPLLWRYPHDVLPHYAVDLPHNVLEQRSKVLAAFDLWADAQSRQEYLGQLRWRLLFDFEGLGPPSNESIYFPRDLIQIDPDEVFVDCGAFDGDTLRDFLQAAPGPLSTAVAFEPDPDNFARLQAMVRSLPAKVQERLEIARSGVAASDGTVRFAAGGGPSSHIGDGDVEIDVVALDSYLGGRRVTFIKMDIEGAELDALRGAAGHIRSQTPILAISCYHRQDHLWTVPLLIDTLETTILVPPTARPGGLGSGVLCHPAFAAVAVRWIVPMKTISVVTPCFNEEGNVEELYMRVRAAVHSAGAYRYEHIFIDNASRDDTVGVLKRLARTDRNVRVIVNSRNFGHVRSPMHALMEARGDAVIGIVADLQDPPELIPEMIRKWEEGYSMVLGIKSSSEENSVMFWIRRKYDSWIQRLSSINTFENFTGFGLYDRQVLEAVRSFNDPYPYFRGMIAEIGLPYVELHYEQRRRVRGTTKNSFYTLYTSQCSASPTCPRCRCALRRCSAFVVRCSVCSLESCISFTSFSSGRISRWVSRR